MHAGWLQITAIILNNGYDSHNSSANSQPVVNSPSLHFELRGSLSKQRKTKLLWFADISYRWVDCYFPFTHPSWELEVEYQGDWMEVLGCGIIEQRILNTGTVNTYHHHSPYCLCLFRTPWTNRKSAGSLLMQKVMQFESRLS